MRFQPGNPGKPKGTKNKKKIIKIEDFIRDNNINVAQEWWNTIMQIGRPDEKAAAIKEYYKYVGTPPKESADDNEDDLKNESSILGIVETKNE